MTHQQQTVFENIVGKGEIARNQQFLLFPHGFQLNQITVSPFVHIFNIISLFAVEFEEPKIGTSGKGLTTQKKKAFETSVYSRNLKIKKNKKKMGGGGIPPSSLKKKGVYFQKEVGTSLYSII